MKENKWPPEGFVEVGKYAFKPPFIPELQQVEQAEQFVFTHPNFLELGENQRRRNVIRLAIAAASNFILGEEEGDKQLSFIPLIGGLARMTTIRHEGTATFSYDMVEDE